MRPSLLVFVLLIVAPSAAAQSLLSDRTFDVNGLTLHIRCGGQRVPGAALVVFEAGAGNSADTWRDVHAPISEFARACAWDRPGRGSSGAPSQALDATAYVPLLSQLLKAANEQGPYLLVGHSIGGVIAALFANAHPSDVAGLVLVDSSHELQFRRFSELNAAPRPGTAPQVSAAPPPGAPSPEPLPIRPLIDLLGERPWRGAVPLVVLTRGKTPPSTGDPNAEARSAIWLDLQRDWATRSPQGKQVIAANSGHYIQNDEPHLVIDAVRAVMTAIAAGK